jgi:hypothetical protein
MLQTGYERGTKDSDVLETADITEDIKTKLLAIGGKKSALHQKHRIFLDIVPNRVPFLPQRALYHGQSDLNAGLSCLEISALDVVDVVVSKLKRFHADDRADIEAMVNSDRVPHRQLVQRFKEAVDHFLGDARAADLPLYVRNLNAVERDYLAEKETEVELPEWIDR